MSTYPTAIDDASSLLVPADRFSTVPLTATMAALCTDSDTTIQVDSTAGFPAADNILSINDELIIYSGKTSTTFTGCIRGAFGTTRIGHARSTAVTSRMVAGYIQRLQEAVIAIEGTLGVVGAYHFGTGGGGASVARVIQTITGDAVIASPGAPADGDLLFVLLTQDGTGGHKISWASAYKLAPVTRGAAGKVASFAFVGSGGNWYMTGNVLWL